MTAPHPFDLTGRVALITGSSRGLGFAMAEALGRAGAHVVLNARSEDALADAAARLAAQGVACSMSAFDNSDIAAGKSAVESIAAKHGRLDILIANAGIQHRSPLPDWQAEDWDRVMAVNLRAVFFLAQAAAAPMVKKGSGRIILTGSMTGIMGRATIHAYVAAKAGVAGLARSLAAELGPQGVTCNSIAPGYFATEMNTPLMKDPVFTERIRTRTALQRWGQPHELAGMAVLLASNAGSYITGQDLVIDGGFTGTM
jgi:gluconate 5-dehydrogenase